MGAQRAASVAATSPGHHPPQRYRSAGTRCTVHDGTSTSWQIRHEKKREPWLVASKAAVRVRHHQRAAVCPPHHLCVNAVAQRACTFKSWCDDGAVLEAAQSAPVSLVPQATKPPTRGHVVPTRPRENRATGLARPKVVVLRKPDAALNHK